MATPQDTVESLMAEAQALIVRVQRDLTASEEDLRRQGINPAQMRAQLEAGMTDVVQEQARQAIQADMDAVEQEVREELARRSFSRPPSSSARRRSMI